MFWAKRKTLRRIQIGLKGSDKRMKRLKTTLSLAGALLLAGCGGGVAMQQVDAGNYVVPGETRPPRAFQVIEIEEINLFSSSFTLTTTETVDYTGRHLYRRRGGLGPARAGLQNGLGGGRAYL